MNQIYSQCDLPEHPDEYIVRLCFEKQCLSRPEYCYLCKTEGKHINHQNQCISFYNLKTKLQETKSTLYLQKEQLLQTLQNVSKLLSDLLHQTYQKKLDDCQLLIQISKDEDVEQSRQKIDLFQYYLNLNSEELRIFLDKIEEICQQFNDQIKEAVIPFEFPIQYDSIIEFSDAQPKSDTNIKEEMNQQFQQIQEDNNQPQVQQIQQVDELNDNEIFMLQIQMIQDEEQAEKIKLSLQLTDEANQNATNPLIAMQIIDQAIELYENNEEALLNKAIILYNLAKLDKSMEVLEKLISLNSQSPKVYYIYAECLNQKGRVQEADQFSQKAILMNQYDPRLYHSRGQILSSLGKFQDAIDCCDKAIALDNENSYVYNTKAHALGNLNRIQDALDNYDLAHRFSPSEIIYLANKEYQFYSLFYFTFSILNLNKLDEAQVCLNKIEQLAEKNEIYFRFKTGLLMKQGKLEQALETCNQGLQFYPNNQTLLQNKQQLCGQPRGSGISR